MTSIGTTQMYSDEGPSKVETVTGTIMCSVVSLLVTFGVLSNGKALMKLCSHCELIKAYPLITNLCIISAIMCLLWGFICVYGLINFLLEWNPSKLFALLHVFGTQHS